MYECEFGTVYLLLLNSVNQFLAHQPWYDGSSDEADGEPEQGLPRPTLSMPAQGKIAAENAGSWNSAPRQEHLDGQSGLPHSIREYLFMCLNIVLEQMSHGCTSA